MGLILLAILVKFWWLILLIIFGICFAYYSYLVNWNRKFDEAVAQRIEREQANKKQTFSEWLEEFHEEQKSNE